MRSSPSECLQNHCTRTNLLKLKTASLKSKTLPQHKQMVQAKHYNRHARNFPVLNECGVRMRPYKKSNGYMGEMPHKSSDESIDETNVTCETHQNQWSTR